MIELLHASKKDIENMLSCQFRSINLPISNICVNHVEGRVIDVAVKLRTGAESVEIQDYDEVGEVEDNEEKYNSQERVDLVVLVVVGLLPLYEQQQTDVGVAQDDDGQNCPAGGRN